MNANGAQWMRRAIEHAHEVRRVTPPNPWVGAVVVNDAGVEVAHGATSAPGGPHAEIAALVAAGPSARGATLYVTLEPCCHVGRTGPCTDAIIEAGISRVIVALRDPDEKVSGRGIATLRAAGVDVVEGLLADEVSQQLASYLWHRRTGRPLVIAKIASTLDGRVAMADGTSQWITSEHSRADAHELRADCQAIIVGAGTVRSDDPQLTARLDGVVAEPLRVVLGTAPANARVRPCWERTGDLEPVLDELGDAGVLQVLIEGGPTTTSAFVAQGLAQRIVWYFAPALAGSAGGLGALAGIATPSMDALRRGRILGVQQIGEDIRVDVEV